MKTAYCSILNLRPADDDKDDRFFFKNALEELDTTYTLNTVPDHEQLAENPKRPARDKLMLIL